MQLTEYGHLIIDDYGAYIRKRRGRIVVRSKEGLKELPLKSLKEVIIMGKVLITSEAIKSLTESGIDMLITTPTGRPLARLIPAKAGGTVRNRYEQYKSLNDRRGVEIARSMVVGKIRNQISNMRYYSKSRRMNEELSQDLYEAAIRLREGMEKLRSERYDSLEIARKGIMAVESRCASLYWSKIASLLNRWGFVGRDQRGLDPVNLCLNVCYNLLSGQIWKYVLRFGLDPFLGYLHVERPGRLSLVYDLMEPFRPMVDRFVISFIRGCPRYLFSESMKSGTILALKKRFFSDFMDSRIEYKGRKLKMEHVLFVYIQEVVSSLREERPPVTPYMPW